MINQIMFYIKYFRRIYLEGMKTLLILLSVVGLSTATNYIVNGNFESPKLFFAVNLFTDNLLGWKGTAQIVKGVVYNKRWKSQVVELDSFLNTVIKQNITLPKNGKYVLKFQYAAREQGLSDLSRMKILWNGKGVQTIICKDYNIRSSYLILNGIAGLNSLVFQNRGKDPIIGITVDNIILEDFNGQVSKNLIINGNFQNPKQTWVSSLKGIKGWKGTIEIGLGNIYNTNWKSQVIELDVDKNEVVTQHVQIFCPGNYILKYQYAARMGQTLATSQMKVLWNNKVIDNVVPNNFKIAYNQVQVKAVSGFNILSFSATGASDSLGITIDNIQLYHRQNFCK